MIKDSLDAPLPGLDLPQDAKLPAAVTFRDASARDVFSALAKFTNLSIAFDPTFRDQPVSIDLRGQTLEQALTSLSQTTRNFWRVTSPRTITVIPDTTAKRREYEEEIVRTFYLSNADLKETIDLLRIVVDARRIAPLTATNALTLKDTPERVQAGTRVKGMFQHCDIAPTVCDLVAREPAPQFDGRSMIPATEGQDDVVQRREAAGEFGAGEVVGRDRTDQVGRVGRRRRIEDRAPLVVAADGRNSPAREAAGTCRRLVGW